MDKKIEASITISDAITPTMAQKFISQLSEMSRKYEDIERLNVFISCPGGDIDLAIEIYRGLQNLGCEIRTINTSYVNSAAIIIFLAGNIRNAYSTSSFYVHSVKKKLRGNYDETQLVRIVKELSINSNKITSILANNTSKPERYWKHLMKKGEILTAKRALQLGLLSSIISAE